MSARLTDEELAEAFDYAHGSLRLTAALIELKERRAADLKPDEIETLRLMRHDLGCTESYDEASWYLAGMELIDRLLAAAEGKS